MPDQPHSKTVRGTLSNPKTKEAIKRGAHPNHTQLGDPASFEAETASSYPTGSDRGAETGVPDDKQGLKIAGEKDYKADNPSGTEGESHARTVRGTMGNPKTHEAMRKGRDANPTQLGDPASLKAETTDSKPTGSKGPSESTGRDSKL